MAKRAQRPIALTVAGSDSGGGAGLQADLKTFASLGVHGTSVVTCLTAQNPVEVLAVRAVDPAMVRWQLDAVFRQLPPGAVKTGMLYSAELIAEVAAFRRRHSGPAWVVDPVMVATSGAALLKPAAVHCLRGRLLPLASLITPNLHEAEMLTGSKIAEPEDLRTVARLLSREYPGAVLIKGGHLAGARNAVDLFYDRRSGIELLLSAPRVKGVSTHGTGCTCSAAITAWLARGLSLPEAVRRAKTYVTQAIARSYRVATHQALNCFWND